MTSFEVELEVTGYLWVSVDAEDDDEARDKALEVWKMQRSEIDLEGATVLSVQEAAEDVA